MLAKFCGVLLSLCGPAVTIVLQQPPSIYHEGNKISIRQLPRDTTGKSLWDMFGELRRNIKIDEGTYDRAKFGGFTKRSRILKRDAKFNSYKERWDHLGYSSVVGTWHSPWDDQLLENVHACAMEIDHVVPLKEAWITGAFLIEWELLDLRSKFMNDEDNLIAVSRTANRIKGERAFPQYKPSNTRARCQFIKIWTTIKYKYALAVPDNERQELREELYACFPPSQIAPLELEFDTKLNDPETIDTHQVANMSQLPVNNHPGGGHDRIRRLPRNPIGVNYFDMLEDLHGREGDKRPAGKTPYARKAFGINWDDMDDVPIREKLLMDYALFIDKKKTTDTGEIYGSWDSPWDGGKFREVHSCVMEIDHIVSLRETWYAGAEHWSAEERNYFATDYANLIPMYSTANRIKGARGFPGWQPRIERERCNFAYKWLEIKYMYELTVDQEELVRLGMALHWCPRTGLPYPNAYTDIDTDSGPDTRNAVRENQIFLGSDHLPVEPQ